MNIYLLSQTENTGYDTYDSCVVIATNEKEAKLIHPNEDVKWRDDLRIYMSKYWYKEYLDNIANWNVNYYSSTDWCKSPDAVMVEYIGEFKGNLNDYPTRIICASFNAG